jgi:hypothetical protein
VGEIQRRSNACACGRSPRHPRARPTALCPHRSTSTKLRHCSRRWSAPRPRSKGSRRINPRTPRPHGPGPVHCHKPLRWTCGGGFRFRKIFAPSARLSSARKGSPYQWCQGSPPAAPGACVAARVSTASIWPARAPRYVPPSFRLSPPSKRRLACRSDYGPGRGR